MATLGQQLKAARLAKGVSEQDAGAATHILTKTIVAMEADDFSGMAAPAYAKGFIRLYANYLGLKPDPLIDEYMDRYTAKTQAPAAEQTPPESVRRDTPPRRPIRPAAPPSANPLKKLLAGPLAQWAGFVRHHPKDIRSMALSAAALLILIVLIVSATNCIRRRSADKTTAQPPAAPRMLLDKPLPDLYLVEPGKIESPR